MALPWRVEPKWPVPTRKPATARGVSHSSAVWSQGVMLFQSLLQNARGSATHATLQPRTPLPSRSRSCSASPHELFRSTRGGMSGGFGTSCIGTCRTTRCLRVGELIACTNSSCSEPGAGYFSWRRIFLFTGSVPLSSPTFNHANRDKTQTEQRNTLKPHSR